ncbi:MAG: hypothetical protein FD133_874 [Erysipelotrichaceae bacterium]|nr:MAG: hypothetical protein FD179_776 [Erysipelotrichaceae bacterium]TXT18378.1 MAG: hypothetical protein FD133_874 [Erysipelotrichaceae bacterium]
MKKPIKILLIVLASAIGLTIVLGLSLNVFSRQIGDFYLSRSNYNEAVIWYEREYDFYHSDNSLVTLIKSLLKVEGQYKEKAKYYSLAIENKPTNMTEQDYEIFYIEYLFALYQLDQISEFKEAFEMRYKLLIASSDYLSILAPFTLIQQDSEATTEVLTWSIEMIEKIITEYDYDDIKRFGYKFESLFYKRLGDLVKATEYEEKSNQYK